MKHNRAIGFLVLFLIAGCAAIPKQLVDAMEVQKQEIDKVKDVYFANLKNQIDAIEKYQLAILDIYENQCISKYSNALDMVTKDGNTAVSYTHLTLPTKRIV